MSVNLDSVAQALRSQLTQLRSAPTPAVAHTTATLAAAQASRTSAPTTRRTRSARPDLASRLTRRLLDVDPNAPDAHQRALAVFLECLLVQECGDDLLNDPGLFNLVASVQAQMQASAELQPLLHQATQWLLQVASSSPKPPTRSKP